MCSVLSRMLRVELTQFVFASNVHGNGRALGELQVTIHVIRQL